MLTAFIHFACLSQRADSRISASLMFDFELEYMKTLHCCGWNSAEVITSVSSSIFTGLISTMSVEDISLGSHSSAELRTEALVADIQVPQVHTQIVR